MVFRFTLSNLRHLQLWPGDLPKAVEVFLAVQPGGLAGRPDAQGSSRSLEPS
jgi:hypothetical protein